MRGARYVIIGGGIAGTTAAETIRKYDADGSIAIVSDEPHRLYSRIMLSKPNFFLGKIPFERIWLKPESWYTENRVELLTGIKATALDAANKTVSFSDGEGLRYEKLLLAIGGCARPWRVGGVEKSGVYYLRTLDEAKAIIAAVKTSRRAVAIGGGFVSFEMCEMMRLAGLEVVVIIREPHYWDSLLDETSGRMIEAALEKGGVRVAKNAEVSAVTGGSSVDGIVLKDGERLSCEMVVVGIGVRCPSSWLAGSGVNVNRGILVNEYLETSAADVWAAGDSAEFNDLILGGHIQLGNWVNAQMQGRAAGLNMVGKREPFRLVSFYTTQGFGMTIAFVGDVRPAADRLIIPRGSFGVGSYGRIIVKDGEIVGATLMNRTQELSPLSKLIERDFLVRGHERELADPHFDLKRFL